MTSPRVTRDAFRHNPVFGDGPELHTNGTKRHTGSEAEGAAVIFKAVREGRPYPDHGFSTRDWAGIPPRQVRLQDLVTTKRELGLDKLLDEESTFYGDLFPHAVQWQGEIYLEDGLHRALRAALQQRTVLHVRLLNLDELTPGPAHPPAQAPIQLPPQMPPQSHLQGPNAPTAVPARAPIQGTATP